MLSSRFLVVAGVLVVAACSGTDGTSPAATTHPLNTIVYATSPTNVIGSPGQLAANPPAVEVALAESGVPVAGVKVTFTFSNERGADYSTVTNSAGIAVLENLRFDSQEGQYTIVATATGAGSVNFVATSETSPAMTYNLQSIDGVTGPPYFMGGDQLDIQGAQYELFLDGTYQFGYVRNGVTQWEKGRLPYIRRNATTIEFYTSKAAAPESLFYAGNHYLFSVGTISGDVMNVKYQDMIDFADETYTLAK